MKLVLSCVSQQKSYRSFKSERRLKQGDPISPLLFIFYAKFFSKIVNIEKSNEKLKGIKVAKGSPAVPHLIYANNILITTKADIKGAEAIKGVFKQFGELLGLKVNNEKLCIFFSQNTDK